MAFSTMSRANKLLAIIAISSSFFVVEIAIGFSTHSLALVADAFHYLSDLLGMGVALAALRASERESSPDSLSFGWQRAQLLGAFFNGIILLALGLSVFLQSIERFVTLQPMENPRLVMIVGCIGLALNLISAAFLHTHCEDHAPVEKDIDRPLSVTETTLSHGNPTHGIHHRPPPPSHDLGMLGILIHLLTDAANNISIIIAALLIWLLPSPSRFYADPAASTVISILLFFSCVPLLKSIIPILLQSVPPGMQLKDIEKQLEDISGVKSVHELHVWRLDQKKSVGSVHVVVSSGEGREKWRVLAERVGNVMHGAGVHSFTLQPEFVEGEGEAARCGIRCGALCEGLRCCP